MSKEQQVILLWGLPGSGKTTYAESVAKKDRDFLRVDIDQITRMSPRAKSDIVRMIGDNCESYLYPNHSIVVDGLVTTNDVAATWLASIQKASAGRSLVFSIVLWEPDREACMHNDQGRRLLGSGLTIQNLPFENPSPELLLKFNIKTVAHLMVVRKPDFKSWSVLNGVSDCGRLESSSWCLGGTWGDCWGNEGTVDSDPQPESFTEFDELMEKVCPSIAFMQYKKVYSACCRIETDYDRDYYGGGRTNAQFVCDVEKLYSMLMEMNLIAKENP